MKLEELSLQNEQKYISYLMRNSQDSFGIPTKYILNNSLRNICISIQEMYTKGIKFTLDELLVLCKEKNSNIEYNQLKQIRDAFTDFENIEFIRKKLKSNFLKNKINKELLEDLLVSSTSTDNPDKELEKIKNILDKINDAFYNLEDDTQILNTSKLIDLHKKAIDERINGVNKRTLGYSILDRNVSRPAAPGEMTLLVGMKGSGKSMLVKNKERNLALKSIPVVSFNMEMTVDSNMDRLLCIGENIELDELLHKNEIEKNIFKIQKGWKTLEDLDNYLYIPDPHMNLEKIDMLLYRCKQLFKEKEVLPKDEYMFVTFDTLDLAEDFDDASPREIKRNINVLHRILRKHKVHGYILLQANENKIRNLSFKKPEEIDNYKIGLEDIEGSSAYSARSRVAFSLNRPIYLKRLFFPEMSEEWELEEDLIKLNCIKQNDGKLFQTFFATNNSFRIFPFMK